MNILYLMDDTNTPLKAKIENASSKDVVKISKKFAKENSIKFCGKKECCNIEIDTIKTRKEYGY